MNCHVVFDTNILVSALLSNKEDSATVLVVERMFDGFITPIYSREIIAEYREVLAREKFHFSQGNIDFLLSAIEKFGFLVSPSSSEIVLPDKKDVPFYEAVMEVQDAYLVTGNIKHFPEEPFIITARRLVEILDNAAL